MKRLAWLACFALAGCGSATFTLPPPGPATGSGRYSWRPLEGIQHPRADFDAAEAAAPRVFRFGQFYYNLYSARQDGVWCTGLTASTDGLDWNLGRKVLVADPRIWEGGRLAAFGSALVIGELIHYWYTAGDPPRIALARSHDGRSWRREQEPVLAPASGKDWDGFSTAFPTVVAAEDAYYMYYTGSNAAGQTRLGLARSPDGVTWKRLRANPLADIAGAPGVAVWRAHGAWWMLRPAGEERLVLSRSGDGVEWEPAPLAFDGAWPSVLAAGRDVHVWYSLKGAIRAGRLDWIPE